MAVPVPDEAPVPAPQARPRAVSRARRAPERAAPPPRSNVKLIAGLVALIVALVGAGAFALWRSATAPAEWREFASPKGGFRVELPAAPRTDIARLIDMPPDPNTVAEGTAFRGTAYAVMWTDFPDGRNGAGDDAILSGAINGLRQEFGAGAVEGVRYLEADGFAAREAAVNVPGEGRAVFRVVVTDARLFVLAVAPSDQNGADAQRFLDSFRVTDPALIASREHRLARARESRERAERAEAHRRKAEEELRLAREEHQRKLEAAEAAKRAEFERKRQAAEADAARFCARQPELSPPDPTKLPGLVAYLSFDKLDGDTVPIWPKGTGHLPKEVSSAPGVRGGALYFGMNSDGAVTVPVATLSAGFMKGPSTVTGWAKARGEYGANLIELSSANGPRHRLALARTHQQTVRALAQVDTGFVREEFRKEPTGRLTEECPNDEKWHHLALVRGGRDERRAVLYLDGEPVAAYAFTAGNSRPTKLHLGALTRVEGAPGWSVQFADRFPELPISAVDEICAFDRALTEHEVRFLAGKGPAPIGGAPTERLVEGPRVVPNAGVAFDPERKTVWVVTAVNGYWADRKETWNEKKVPALLVRYSYPEFKETGRWVLSDAAPGKKGLDPIGGPPVLAAAQNRLYVPLNFTSHNSTNLQAREYVGSYFLYDLARLPKWEAGDSPVELAPVAQIGNTGFRPQTAGGFASPDGDWFYYVSATATAVQRCGGTLNGVTGSVASISRGTLAPEVWRSADGKVLRALGSDGATGLRVFEIDVQNGALLGRREVFGDKSVQAQYFTGLTVHPDGRVFVCDGGGLLETVYANGTATKRYRPFEPSAFLNVSTDGRYMFAAQANTAKNRLFVLDARANPERLDELASIEETPERRIGGPFWVSPDGTCVVFRSGQVVRLEPVPLPKP
jgi:hypothetical protein